MHPIEFAQKIFLAITLGTVPKSRFNKLLSAAYPTSSHFYKWTTFYQREGKQWEKDWGACIANYAKMGLLICEPSFNETSEVLRLAPFLKKISNSVTFFRVKPLARRY